MKVYVGLGNPGDQYERTRHNAGFWAVEALAARCGADAWKSKFNGLLCQASRDGDKTLFFKPLTYMNRSGLAVGALAAFYKIPVDGITVYHDELDLPPGSIRCKTGGGHAGHNGLKSLDSVLGRDYHRVRLGIGHPGDRSMVSDYVLSPMPAAERQLLLDALENVLEE